MVVIDTLILYQVYIIVLIDSTGALRLATSDVITGPYR